jgi:hypothetical protein
VSISIFAGCVLGEISLAEKGSLLGTDSYLCHVAIVLALSSRIRQLITQPHALALLTSLPPSPSSLIHALLLCINAVYQDSLTKQQHLAG